MTDGPDEEKLRARVQAADFLRYDMFKSLSDRVVSHWLRASEAADHGEAHFVEAHCRQIRLLTKTAFDLVKTIGMPPSVTTPDKQTRSAEAAE